MDVLMLLFIFLAQIIISHFSLILYIYIKKLAYVIVLTNTFFFSVEHYRHSDSDKVPDVTTEHGTKHKPLQTYTLQLADMTVF